MGALLLLGFLQLTLQLSHLLQQHLQVHERMQLGLSRGNWHKIRAARPARASLGTARLHCTKAAVAGTEVAG